RSFRLRPSQTSRRSSAGREVAYRVPNHRYHPHCHNGVCCCRDLQDQGGCRSAKDAGAPVAGADPYRGRHDRPAQGGLEPAFPAGASCQARRTLQIPARVGAGRSPAIRQAGRTACPAAADHRGTDRRSARWHRRERTGPHHHRSRAMTGTFGRLPRLPRLLRRKNMTDDNAIVVDGARKAGGGRIRTRVIMTMSVFLLIYAAIAGRLAWLGFQDPEASGPPPSRVTASRPDIVDRNGEVLATDIKTASLFAEPRHIVDADEAIEKLSTVLPEIDYEQTYHKLKSGAGFVWLQRQLTPKQQAEILRLGIPGIGFRTEKRRFYPAGSTAAYVVGLTNIDNKGISGMEKYLDDQGLTDLQEVGLARDMAPVRLSIDLRVQHVVHDELLASMQRYQARVAGAGVLNAKTGEVMAMASVPDFDPNNPYNAQDKDRLNRMSAGLYEMGSTFKSFTTAMVLDSGQ